VTYTLYQNSIFTTLHSTIPRHVYLLQIPSTWCNSNRNTTLKKPQIIFSCKSSSSFGATALRQPWPPVLFASTGLYPELFFSILQSPSLVGPLERHLTIQPLVYPFFSWCIHFTCIPCSYPYLVCSFPSMSVINSPILPRLKDWFLNCQFFTG
jgi:hypothetical protein